MKRPSLGWIVAWTALAAAAFGVLPQAFGQASVGSSQSAYIVVQEAQAALRCRPGDVSYEVASLKHGTVLKEIGTRRGWSQVEYPEGLVAVVKLSDVEYRAGSAEVVLTTSSRLRAHCAGGTARSHWWSLLDDGKQLAAGTRLKVLEELRREDGELEGFKVPAPKGAMGFIRTEQTRAATAEEMQAFRQRGNTIASATTKNADATRQLVEETPEVVEPIVDAAPPSPPTTEVARETTEPVEIEMAPRTDVVLTEADSSADAPATERTIVVPPPELRNDAAISSIDQLMELYDSVLDRPLLEAEIDAAIAEFDRSVVVHGNAWMEGERSFVESRAEVLRIRSRVRDLVLRQRSSETKWTTDIERVTTEVVALKPIQKYDLVGELVPSSVYDGRRLPLMFRVQVAEEGFNRTVGYVRPTERFDVSAFIGRQVGVRGEVKFEEPLGVNVVMPETVIAID